MRVLVLSNLYPPQAMGGYEMSCRDVVDRWRSRGHQVTVLTTAAPLTGAVEPVADEPHVRRELGWYWADHVFVRPPVRERLGLERRNVRRLRTALRQTRPDVVSVWHMGGMSLSLLGVLAEAAVPVVLNICDEWPVYAPRADAWTDAWARRPGWQRRLAARLTGLPPTPDLDRWPASLVSSFTLDRVRAGSAWRFPRTTVVGSGVDTDDFPLASVDERPWRWRLLGVGRLEPRKGFETAVEALALLPEQARLRLVGVADPEHLAALLGRAEQLGVRDRVEVGAVPRSRLAEVYAGADVVLFPSRWDEPFGLVPLEAMTQATPVVATRRGGSAEFLLDGQNCLAVPHDEPAALAAAVRRLADEPGLRHRLATGGLATAERYTADRLADLLEREHRAAVRSVATAETLADCSSASWGEAAPPVSVVVATHDRAGLLPELFAALEALDPPEGGFEVVLADDGSTDGTWAGLERLVAVTPLAVLALRLPASGGASVPRNTAATRAAGTVLALTDDDCLPTPYWLAELVAPLSDPAVTVAQGRTLPEPGGWAGPWGRSLEVTRVSGLYETANLACRRSDFLSVGGFRTDRLVAGRPFGEDASLGSALAQRGRVAFTAAALTHHRVLPGSYRTFLAERRRLRGFPLLAEAVPELRRQAPLGVFLSPRTAVVDAGALGLAASVLTRRPALALAALPWARDCWRASVAFPGRPRIVRAAQLAAADLVGLASLAEGSLRARRVLL